MTVPATPPAGPARVQGQRPEPAAPDPRRADRFGSLLGRSATAEAERRAAALARRRDAGTAHEERGRREAGEGALDPVLQAPASSLGQPALLPTFEPATRTDARSEPDVTAAAQLVESVQVGLDRAGQAEVRFDVAEGPLKGLEVLLRAAPGGIEARFVADDAATRRALAEPLLELQRTLADRGIVVASLEVTVRADVGGGHGSPQGHGGDSAAPAPLVAWGPDTGAASGTVGAPIGLPPLRSGSPTDWVA